MPCEKTIVFGPPGTGKTTHLINRVREELERGTEPERIAYVSFTRTAANEARDRAMDQFKVSRKQFKWFRTIHSMAFNQLGVSRDSMFTYALLPQLGRELHLQFSRSPDDIAARVKDGDDFIVAHQLLRSTGLDYFTLWRKYSLRTYEADYRRLQKLFDAWKKQNALLEFHDLLEQFIERCGPVDVDAVFIDEAQDLTALQWRVLHHAFGHVPRWVIAGDDDQAIFEWAGADVRSFLRQSTEHIVLNRSFRVPESLRKYADKIARRIRGRKEKSWAGTDYQGKLQSVRDLSELSFKHRDESYLLLARHKCFLKDLSAQLSRAGRLHFIENELSVPLPVIKAHEQMWAIQRGEPVLAHSASELLQHCAGRMKFRRGEPITRNDLNTLRPFENMSSELQDAVREARKLHGDKLPREPLLRLSTIHTAKGTEADNVVLLTTQTRASGARPTPPAEDRTFYVGATRARKRLGIFSQYAPFEYNMPM